MKSSSRTAVNDSSFRVSIPLSSASSSNSFTTSVPTVTLPSDHTYSIPVMAQSTVAHSSATQNSTSPLSGPFAASSSNGSSAQLTPFNRNSSFLATHFSGPHSPIAMLAPHASHTLPLTSLGSSSTSDSNELSIHDASSLPYYYPPEWNGDDFNTSFSPSSTGMVHPLDTTTTSTGQQSLYASDSSFDNQSHQTFTPNGADILNDGFIHELTPQHSLNSSSIEPNTDNDDNDSGVSIHRPLHVYPRELASDRISQQRRNSESRRRQGVSYSSDQHQHMLQFLQPEEPLQQMPAPQQTPPPPILTPSYNFRRRAGGEAVSRSEAQSRLQHSLNQIAARQSGRARPGRSGLDMVYSRPLNGDSNGSSTSQTDEQVDPSSPSILTNNGDYFGLSGRELPQFHGGEMPELLSVDGRVEQDSVAATNSSEDTDVITISSDDEVSVYAVG